jgi:FemAB-related protein (PEP-CTERM system-associated)
LPGLNRLRSVSCHRRAGPSDEPQDDVTLRRARTLHASFQKRHERCGSERQNQDETVTVEIKELMDSGVASWDKFVLGCEQATFFHLAAWRRIIEDVFRHRTHYLHAVRDGRVVGVLPLAHSRSLLFGNALVSLPFCVYGGVATNDSEAYEALIRAAVELARRLRVEYLELRDRADSLADWPEKSLYVTFRKNIEPNVDANLQAVPRKQRAMIRKGIQEGLSSETDGSLDDFFKLYSLSVRNLGTPVFPARYFRALKETFGDACEILTIKKNGRSVASVLSFYFRDEVLPYYGGGDTEARDSKANDFMYWELMRRSCEKGVRVFDFGRSKVDTGSYRFKKHWGFEPEPLHYKYHLVTATGMPDLSPANPKYRLFIAGWKKLPLPVSQWLGPKISRFLG